MIQLLAHFLLHRDVRRPPPINDDALLTYHSRGLYYLVAPKIYRKVKDEIFRCLLTYQLSKGGDISSSFVNYLYNTLSPSGNKCIFFSSFSESFPDISGNITAAIWNTCYNETTTQTDI